MSLDKIVELIVQKCVKYLKVEQVAVMLLERKIKEKPFQTMIRRADTTNLKLPYRLNSYLTGWMLKNQQPLLINDFPNDSRFKSAFQETFPIQSLLTVPLFSKGKMIGLISCFNKKTAGGFTADDQRLLSIIAAQSAQVIENARLSEEEQILFQIQEEMRLASEIQSGLLPKAPPKIKGYDIAGISYPAKVVGGDYFDFIPLEENKIAVCLGDISGKGLPAALLMANLQAIIRAQALLNLHPKDCLQQSNKLLYQSTDPQKFATLFYGILDTQKNQFSYSNAGHNRPVFLRKGKEPVFLEKAGIALSFIENFSYEEDIITFIPDDTLVIYSDGITEAMNGSEEEFGEKRLVSIAENHIESSAEELMEKIITSVKQHAGNQPQSDDITLVIIKRKTKQQNQ